VIRSKPAAFTLLAVLCIAGYWFFSGPSVNSWKIVNNPPLAAGPVVAFGDSLTAGFGSGGPGRDYPAVLSGLIGREVINLGVNGDTVSRAYGRIEKLEALSPSVVLLLLGGNDLLRRANLDESFALLGEMIRRIQSGGALVVLLGIDGLPLAAPLGKRYLETARTTGALLVPDILKDILGKGSLMADGIHPNGEGYRIMAERVAKTLKPYLR
jgi:lysophospholipase L1-like esterase